MKRLRWMLTPLFVLALAATGQAREDALDMTVHAVAGGKGVRAQAPRVASGPANKMYLAWEQAGDVMVSSSLADGDSWSKPMRVSDGNGTAYAGHGEGPSLAVDRLGYTYLSWTDARRGQSTPDVYFSRSGVDVAESFTAPVRVNDDDRAGSHTFQSLAVDEVGTIYVSWLDERSGTPALYVAHSTDGRAFGNVEASRGFPGQPCDCCRTSLRSDGAGHVWVAFRNNVNNVRDVYATWSGDRGATFQNPLLVSPDRWRLNGCPMAGPAIAVGSDNLPLVLWWTGRAEGGSLQLARATPDVRAFGKPLLEHRLIIGANHPALASQGANLLAAWEDRMGDRPVVRAAYSDDGGASFRPLRFAAGGESVAGRFPAVALDAQGRPLVAWENDGVVYAAFR